MYKIPDLAMPVIDMSIAGEGRVAVTSPFASHGHIYEERQKSVLIDMKDGNARLNPR